MGLFRRSAGRVEERAFTADEVLALMNDRRRSATAAPSVTTDSALRLSAVWACIRLLAGLGSTLPLDQQRTREGITVDVTRSGLWAQPQPGVNLSTWLYQLWSSLLTDGNAYGLVTATQANGFPSTVELLDPASIQWRADNGEWKVAIDRVDVQRWPNGPLWHVPIFTLPGAPYGLSPIQHAKTTISGGLSAERFGSDFFTNGGTPNAILYSDAELSQEQAQGIKSAFVSSTAGNREPAVMGAGLRYERIQVSPEEAQFLDTQRFTVEQIARIYGVFPEMIGGATSGSNVTYANREQRAADFLTFGLMPYLVAIEDGLSSMVPQPERMKFNLDGVLRSDLATRYNAHASAIRAGWLSVNEVRQIEDREPIPGADDLLWPPYRAFPVEADIDAPAVSSDEEAV
jgi:HK97 family phage portal protein